MPTPSKKVVSALKKVGFEAPKLQRIPEGRNSSVWKAQSGDQFCVVKEYFDGAKEKGSRLRAECRFLEYLNKIK